MIKLIESFDHLGVPLLSNLGWAFPESATLLNGQGRFGSRALQVGTGTMTHPAIQRKCNTIVVGFCLAEGGGDTYWDTQYGSSRSYAWHHWPTIDLRFCYGTHINFRVRLVLKHPGYIVAYFYTGEDGSGYPTILTPEYLPCPYAFDGFTFIEVYLDVTDYKNGRAKVAVNNRTYIDKSGIVTADYLAFGDDPYDDRAHIDRVTFDLSNSEPNPYYPPDTLFRFDTIYLCDDQGGYQNDFLGDVHMKTCYPVNDGVKNDWMAVDNGTVVDAPGEHHLFVDDDPIPSGDETTYLEAGQDLTSELFTFETDPVPPGSTLIVVNSRTMARNVASPGLPKANSIVPLYQIQGNPILETNSLAMRGAGWNYYFLDVYYPLVPGFATPWAEYLLEQSQFGFMLRTAENLQQVEEAAGFADEVIDE